MGSLNADTLCRMAPAMVFKDQPAPINSMDFSDDGEMLVAACDDESVSLYNCSTGKLQKVCLCKKYGVDRVRFTHAKEQVICASKNDWDHSLRLHALFDNQYLRYFKGHRDRVTGIAMSPKGDQFMSASLDRTVRLWDLNTPSCQGILHTDLCERSCVSLDPDDRIFAAVTAPETIKLFDVRAFDKGPFATFPVSTDTLQLAAGPGRLEFTGMCFSPDGKWILVATNRSAVLLVDAFEGELQAVYQGHVSTGLGVQACFTPDAKFVLSGSEDGTVHVWETAGRHVCTHSHHAAATKNVLFNPTKMLMASACHNLSFWLPAPLR